MRSMPLLLIVFGFVLISALYFLLLVAGLDGRLALVSGVLITGCYGIMAGKGRLTFPDKRIIKGNIILLGDLFIWLSGLAFLSFLLLKSARIEGDWDAWGIWNLHARFICYPEQWTALLDPAYGWSSRDYPLNLPGFIAALWRFTGPEDLSVPFIAAYLSAVLVPSVIFFELSAVNRVLAVFSLLFFISNSFYIQMGVAQYADVLLGLLYVCSIICIETFRKEQKDRNALFLSGFFLMAAAWTKNEGVFFIVPFLVVYSGLLLRRSALTFWAGALLILLPLILFKTAYAPLNYGTRHFSVHNFNNFLVSEKYSVILDHILLLIRQDFSILVWGSVIIIASSICLRRIQKSFLVLLCSLTLYCAIFLYFDFPLEWQLATSFNRLLLQLVIPFVFVVFVHLSDVISMINRRVKTGGSGGDIHTQGGRSGLAQDRTGI